MRKIKAIVVHCTGADNSTLESITRYHKLVKKWRTIGYHSVVEADGDVFAGRPEWMPGAHTAGWNGPTLAVVMVGDLNVHPPTPAQLEATVRRCASWCKQHGLTATDVYGHRETGPFVPAALRTRKPCPGRMVDMDSFRARLDEVLRDG